MYKKGLNIELGDSKAGKVISPTGKTPVLQVDDNILFESEVICEYLDDLFPQVPLRPDDLFQRAQARLLSRLVDHYLISPVRLLFGQVNLSTRSQVVVDRQIAELDGWLTVVNSRLDTSGDDNAGYAVGGRLSLADCALVPVLFLISRLLPVFAVDEPFAKFPALAQYWKGVQADATCAQVIAELAEAIKARL
jgi:glutathione S-transferase